MRYAQVRFDDDNEFFKLKTAALKARVSLEEFIKSAISEKIILESEEVEDERD